MRILIADDHPLVRRGLKQVLADAFGRVEFGEVSDGREPLERVRGESWDIVLLDINMPGRSGLDVLADLKPLRPRPPVLVLSVHPEDAFALRALKSDAAGYVTKDAAPAELVAAVRKVLSGGRYLSPSLAERLVRALGEDTERPPHDALSDREFQVLRAIASGKSVSEVAAEMSLSVKTVSTYRARILQKLRLQTTADLIRYAIQKRLVE